MKAIGSGLGLAALALGLACSAASTAMQVGVDAIAPADGLPAGGPDGSATAAQWLRRSGGEGLERINWIGIGKDGRTLATAAFEGTLQLESVSNRVTSAGRADVALVWYGPDGSVSKVTRAGGPGDDRPVDGVALDDGSFVLTSWLGVGAVWDDQAVRAPDAEMYRVRLDASGKLSALRAAQRGHQGMAQLSTGVLAVLWGIGPPGGGLSLSFPAADLMGPSKAESQSFPGAIGGRVFAPSSDMTVATTVGFSKEMPGFPGVSGEVSLHNTNGRLWTKRLGDKDSGLAISAGTGASDGTFCFAGYVRTGPIVFDPARSAESTVETAGFLARWDRSGEMRWIRRLETSAGAQQFPWVTSMVVATDSSIWIVGTFEVDLTFSGTATKLVAPPQGSPPRRQGSFVAHYSSEGGLLSAQSVAGAEMTALAAHPDGGVVLAANFGVPITLGAPWNASLTPIGPLDFFIARMLP